MTWDSKDRDTQEGLSVARPIWPSRRLAIPGCGARSAATGPRREFQASGSTDDGFSPGGQRDTQSTFRRHIEGKSQPGADIWRHTATEFCTSHQRWIERFEALPIGNAAPRKAGREFGFASYDARQASSHSDRRSPSADIMANHWPQKALIPRQKTTIIKKGLSSGPFERHSPGLLEPPNACERTSTGREGQLFNSGDMLIASSFWPCDEHRKRSSSTTLSRTPRSWHPTQLTFRWVPRMTSFSSRGRDSYQVSFAVAAPSETRRLRRSVALPVGPHGRRELSRVSGVTWHPIMTRMTRAMRQPRQVVAVDDSQSVDEN